MTYKTEGRHISLIRSGDTIKHNGRLMTVCKCDIKRGFMGITIFGDCYAIGAKQVKKVIGL